MPQHARVAAFLHTFMADLEKTIRAKVSEAVTKVAHDFCTGTAAVAQTVKTAAEKIPRKRRRRRGAPRGLQGHAIHRARPSKKVRLSENGKRIGRPPKAKSK